MTNRLCKACYANITDPKVGQFSHCPECGSANYISDRSAEDDNNDYFNNNFDSTSDPLRERIFSYFNAISRQIHRKEAVRFDTLLSKIDNELLKSGTCLEIGFGGGDELVQRLNAGTNIYGSDISRKVVDEFRNKYPEYAERVTCENATNLGRKFNSIYSNAMFEHLDEPDVFLEKLTEFLPVNGKLIMRIPLVTSTPESMNPYDINFWAPCHRVLYSRTGLDRILKRHGLTIIDSAQLNYYGYKVMNTMLERGKLYIHNVRNPYYTHPEAEGIFDYVSILFKSLYKTSICSDFALIAEKSI